MKKQTSIFVVSGIILFWIVSSIAGALLFYPEENFLDILILAVPAADLFVRLLAIVFFAAIGLFNGSRSAKEESLVEDSANPKEYEELVENTNDGIINVSPEGELLFINQQAQRLLGVGYQDLKGKDLFVNLNIISDSDEQLDLRPLVSASIEKNKSQTIKNGYNLFSQTGKNYYVELKIVPLIRKRDTMPSVSLFIKDITTEKKKQIKLTERESRYNNIISNTNDGLLLIDEQGVIYEWNDALEKITGLHKGSTIGYFYWEIQFELMPDDMKEDVSIEKLKVATFEAINDKNPDFFNKLSTMKIKCSDNSIKFIEQNFFRIPFEERRTKIGCIFRNVTEYHYMLVKLRESEEKFSKTFVLAPEPIMVYNLEEGIIIDINDRFTQVFGFDRASVINNTAFDGNFWENGDVRKEIFRVVHKQGTLTNYEVKNKSADKSTIYSLVSASNIEINGETCIIIYLKDITLRKEKEDQLNRLTNELEYRIKERTIELETINEKLIQENLERIKIEDALRESEEDYRTLINQIPIGIYRTTIDGAFLQANPALADILGADSVEELYSLNVFDFYLSNEDRKSLISKQADRKGIVKEEMQIRRKNGEVIWIRDQGQIIAGPNGETLFTSGTIENITVQKKAMEDLEYSEERYRLLFEDLHDIFFRIDDQYKILTLSPSATKEFGIDNTELIGQGLNAINWSADDRQKLMDMFRTQDRINNFIVSFESKTGRTVYLSIDAHTRYDKKLQKKVIEGIARVITGDIKQRNFLSTIFSISQAANSSATLEELFRSIYDAIHIYTDSPNFVIALYNKDLDDISYPFYSDEARETINDQVTDETRFLVPNVIKNDNSLFLKKKQLTSLFDFSKSKEEYIPCTWIGIPLKSDNEIIGAIVIKDYKNENAYDSDDFKFFSTFADQTASAIVRKRHSIILNFQLNFLQNLIDTIPNPVFYKEVKHNTYQGCNKSFEQVVMLPKEEIIGKTDLEIFGEKTSDYFRQKDRDILQSGDIQRFELKLTINDNLVHDCVFYRSIYYDRDSKMEIIVGTILDISEIRKAEEEIREAREYAELVYNLTPSCIYTFDKELNITSWNERIAKLTGFSYDEVIGRKCRLYMENDLEDLSFVFMPGVKTPIIGKESIIITKKGIRRIVSKNIDILKNADGEIIGGIESFEDITGRKRIEEALYWQAGVNSAIAELSKAIMVIPSFKDISQMILEHGLRLTGSTTGFIGTIDPVKGYMKITAASNDIKANSEIDIFSKSYQEYTGSWGWALRNKRSLIINSPATDPRSYESNLWNVPVIRFLSTPAMSSNKLTGIIALANAESDYGEKELEIVERMSSLFSVALQRIKAEEEIRAALGKEQELNELKSRFIAMVSHEYRTPLTAIVLATELLSEYDERLTKDNRNEQFTRIRQSVKVMNALLDDIIAYNKAELGKLEFFPQYVDIEKFCLSLANEVEMVGKNKSKIDLTVRNGNILANIDENLVRKILVNLLSNAMKYSPENTVIEFDVNVKKDEVEFVVKDNGYGMSEETRERLFEPFFRGENVGNISGTGLGLAVVKSSVDIHKGRIYFDSEPGKGTTFVVTIPFYEKSKISKSIFKKHIE